MPDHASRVAVPTPRGNGPRGTGLDVRARCIPQSKYPDPQIPPPLSYGWAGAVSSAHPRSTESA